MITNPSMSTQLIPLRRVTDTKIAFPSSLDAANVIEGIVNAAHIRGVCAKWGTIIGLHMHSFYKRQSEISHAISIFKKSKIPIQWKVEG